MSVSEGGGEGRPPKKPTARQVIAARIRKATAFFEQPDVTEAIEHSAHETLKWLTANKHSFDVIAPGKREDGIFIKREPWWKELPPTNDPILLDARKRAMESSCFENGLRKLHEALVEYDIGYPKDYRTLKSAVDYRAIAVHYQLVAFNCVGHDPINLADMAKRFDYGAPAKLRDSMVAQMAELGLWNALIGKQDHERYALSLGPVAHSFHVNALFPAIEHFSQDKFLGKKKG